MTLFRSPQQAYAGDIVSISITLTNGISQAVDVSSIAIRFGWSSTTYDWGTMSLPAYGSDTNTFSLTMTSNPGEYSVQTTVTGRATGDFFAESCFFSGTMRILAVPPPPDITATANPTTGSIPLSVTFTSTVTGGVAPFSYSWTFGDGQSGAGQTVTHVYNSPGTYVAQVVVTDSRGRSDSDQVTVNVAAAFIGAGGHIGTILIIAVLAVVVIVVTALVVRRKRVQMPPSPPVGPPPTRP